MKHEQPTYVYDSKPKLPGHITVDGQRYERSDGGGGAIVILILILGGLMTAELWIRHFIQWARLVATHPVEHSSEAVILTIIACIAAYYTWRAVRMAVLMTLSLIELTIYSFHCIRDAISQYLQKKGFRS